MPVDPINLAPGRGIASSVFSSDCPHLDTRGYRKGVCSQSHNLPRLSPWIPAAVEAKHSLGTIL